MKLGTMFIIVSYVWFSSPVYGLKVTLVNRCPLPIWPAVTGSPATGASFSPMKLLAENSSLSSSQYFSNVTFEISPPWSGRLWAREGCDDNGAICIVGSCSGKRDCRAGLSSDNTTLVELTVAEEYVNYDISLVDGHTRPVRMSFPDFSVPGKRDCSSRECLAPADLGRRADGSVRCPPRNRWAMPPGKPLPTIGIADNNRRPIMACLSDCTVNRDERSCCTGKFNSPTECPPTSLFFREVCPEAFSFAYHDSENRQCNRKTASLMMLVEFCPQ